MPDVRMLGRFSGRFTFISKPVARKIRYWVLCPRHRCIELSLPPALRVRGIIPGKKWNFVRKIMQFCVYLHGTAVSHWQGIIKCRAYIVMWASVGAQSFGGGARAPTPRWLRGCSYQETFRIDAQWLLGRNHVTKVARWQHSAIEWGTSHLLRTQSFVEIQLSQRDRAMLRVIKYFTKSLNVTQGHWKYGTIRKLRKFSYSHSIWLYLVLFLRYSEILVKNRDFSYLLSFNAPVKGSRRNITITFGTATKT